MSSISKNTSDGDFLINSDGGLKYVQKWKFHFETKGGPPWSDDEKESFKRLSILQVTSTWDKRIAINVTPLKHVKKTGLPKYPSSKEVVRKWHVKIAESNKPHWDVFVYKLKENSVLLSPDDRETGGYVLHSNNTVILNLAAFNANANNSQSRQSTMAHEFGHMLAKANVDEYRERQKNSADVDSIMNTGSEPRSRHLGGVLQNYNAMVGNVGFSFGSYT